MRRSFHTLKGSGRMVGAQLLGEFCWSVENLLNRIIDKTLARTPADDGDAARGGARAAAAGRPAREAGARAEVDIPAHHGARALPTPEGREPDRLRDQHERTICTLGGEPFSDSAPRTRGVAGAEPGGAAPYHAGTRRRWTPCCTNLQPRDRGSSRAAA